MSKPSTDGILMVASKYKVDKVLGKGSFGELRKGKNLETGEPVAIKFELKNISSPQLPLEYGFYKRLGNDEQGIPKLLYFAPVPKSDYHCLVMELLGNSLEGCFDKCDRSFSLKTVLMISIQMLERLEYIHRKGIINRDIKPDNFLTGRKGSPGEKIIHIIDFGLAKFYMENGEHIEFNENTPVLGTHRYMSINGHKQVTLSRRDDLEAIGYIMIYFLNGILPWQGLDGTPEERFKKIGRLKMNTSVEELCKKPNGKSWPKAFVKFFKYVRGLKFKETPNYEQCKQWFRECFDEEGFLSDNKFDWDDDTRRNIKSGSSSGIGLKQQVKSNAKNR